MENNFKFYNTLTKKIETVIPHEDGKICLLYTSIVTEAAVNELGNNGEHVRAEEIDRKSIKASLSCRRVWDIHYKIYDILWNEKKLMKKSGKRVSNNRMNTELKRCIIMSHYVKRYFYENVYKEKLS